MFRIQRHILDSAWMRICALGFNCFGFYMCSGLAVLPKSPWKSRLHTVNSRGQTRYGLLHGNSCVGHRIGAGYIIIACVQRCFALRLYVEFHAFFGVYIMQFHGCKRCVTRFTRDSARPYLHDSPFFFIIRMASWKQWNIAYYMEKYACIMVFSVR